MDALLDAKKILVVAPHPDDETLGCGGTIAVCSARGAEVHVTIVSDGGKISPEGNMGRSDVVALRKKEAGEACRILGVKEVSFLDYPDGALKEHEGRIKADIGGIIDAFNPDVLLVPSPLDYHEDHVAVAAVGADLAASHKDLLLALFQVGGTLRFNALIDIAGVLDIKERAVRCYKCSLFGDPELFLDSVRGVNRFWSFYARSRSYYEAFFVVPPSFDRQGIIRWLTYGEKELSPEEIYLSQLKAVDELLAQEKKSRETIISLESTVKKLRGESARGEELIARLEADIASKTESLTAVSRDIEVLKRELDAVTRSVFWGLATKFYRIRDRLLPEGSSRRKVYDSLKTLTRL